MTYYGIADQEDTTAYDVDQDADTIDTAAAAGGATGHRRDKASAQPRHEAGAGAEWGDSAERKSSSESSPNEIVLSEEHLNVDKQRVATEEVRLRKYVTTETETVEDPVSREEVTIERTPISDEDAASYADDIGEQEASVTLYADQVSVTKEAKPVEKVSLREEEVQETKTFSDDVRREHIDTSTTNPDEK